MSEPILEIKGLRRTYHSGGGQLDVLRGVDLTLHPGELVGLLGPSGSGKSSLLHAAGLLEKPNGGSVSIAGVDALSLTDGQRTGLRRSKIGFVYQFHHLLPELTALQNVMLPQRMAGKSEKLALREAERLLTLMGLAERMHHQPGQLSGGEQQRVAIARALANAPVLLLADEPTGNLDPATSANVFQSLFDLVRTEKVSALVATHNHDLMGFMDRIFQLNDGHLHEHSTNIA
jgi:lipoprotein-releasing system ATP-binding protein